MGKLGNLILLHYASCVSDSKSNESLVVMLHNDPSLVIQLMHLPSLAPPCISSKTRVTGALPLRLGHVGVPLKCLGFRIVFQLRLIVGASYLT